MRTDCTVSGVGETMDHRTWWTPATSGLDRWYLWSETTGPRRRSPTGERRYFEVVARWTEELRTRPTGSGCTCVRTRPWPFSTTSTTSTRTNRTAFTIGS